LTVVDSGSAMRVEQHGVAIALRIGDGRGGSGGRAERAVKWPRRRMILYLHDAPVRDTEPTLP
jgi:hypothetical protein